jgi:hypothetical protein
MWIKDEHVELDASLQRHLADQIAAIAGMPKEAAEALVPRLFAGESWWVK